MAYNSETKLQQAFHVVLKEFENYKNNLADKSILVIYRNRETKELDYITVEFTGSNYYHLTGDFNESGLKLQLDKVIGNTKTCLGLRKIGYKKYAPASSLYDDTRKYAKVSHQIVTVFMKETDQPQPYKTIKYVAKGHNLNHLI